MKQLWTGKDPVRLGILQSELEKQGIRFSIRNADLQSAMGELPPIETWPEIWIWDEDRFTDAEAILRAIE